MMKVKRSKLLAVSLLVLLSTSGCKREATGQVVAVVNGEEITLQEINAELSGAQIPQNTDTKQIQQRLLQRIVERRLVAGTARADGIDKDQEYLLKHRQMDDSLLIQLLGERTGRTFRIPDPSALDKYIATHPTIFGQRVVYQVDQILFAPPSDFNQIRKLKDDHSLDAVAATLTSLGIKFQRSNGQLDSAKLAPDMIAHMNKLPQGEPFLVPQPGSIFVGVITAITPAPLAVEDARPLAIQFMRKEAVDAAFKQRLKTAKAEAKIEYQPGFAPAPVKK